MIITTDKQLPARHEHDFYETPADLCVRSLAVLPADFSPTRILDPGCGTGVWGQAAVKRWPGVNVDGAEIRNVDKPEGYRYLYGGDFRLGDFEDYHAVIGNPPYAFAESFIRIGLEALNPGGYLVFLLRLAFLEGKGRAKGLYRQYPLKECHVVGRVSFSGNNKTNTTAFALFVWQKGYTGETALKWMVAA